MAKRATPMREPDPSSAPNAQAEELGALLWKLEVAPGDQRFLAWVRGSCALMAAACAILVLLAKVPVPVFLAAVLGLLMALVWLRQAARAARSARAPEAHYLAAYQHGLVVREAQKVTRVLFVDVRAIEQDDDVLDIVLQLRNGTRLRIEPRYPGLAIHELVAKLQEAAKETWAKGPAQVAETRS